MRHLGIDFGSKKIGLALSDESGVMAFPHAVVPNNQDFLAYLFALIQEKKVAVVVIGQSLDKAGKPNAIQAAIEDLVVAITLEAGLPVHLEPEQFTTQAALRLQGRTTQTDASAAALILDNYLQRQ